MTKKIKLALQAGGALGAIECGALIRILEDDRFEITGLSGASAGSIMSVACAAGMDEGGRQGAIQKLNEVLEAQCYDEALKQIPLIGKPSSFFSRKFSSFAASINKYDRFDVIRKTQANVHAAAMGVLSRILGNIDTLIKEQIDFEALRTKKDGVPVFVCATDIADNTPRVFGRQEICEKAVMASCAIPGVIGAVEIGGRKYWDGAMSDNPAIEPLKNGDDIIVIQTFPYQQMKAEEKANPLNKLVDMFCNNSVRKDIESIQKDNQRITDHPAEAAKIGLKTIHTHMINIDELHPGKAIPNHSLCFDRHHLYELRDAGYQAADKWIKENYDNIGVKSTFTGFGSSNSDKPVKKRKPSKSKST